MRIVIVDDEPPARERLAAAIRAAEPAAEIAAQLGGVAETVAWLDANPSPALLFLDIQLSDGLSFEILRRTRVVCPVIFATAFDEYFLEAFENNGIDYLLKPFEDARVAAALAKYRTLSAHFNAGAVLAALEQPRAARRERFLVRKGADLISVRAADAAYLYTTGGLVFLMTRSGARYLLDRPLADVEGELDPSRFFRANRAYLVQIDAVARCRPYGKGRLLLELAPPAPEEVVVSQERAAAFRQWMGG